MGGLVSTVSTDHFEEVCLGTKHISIQGSRFNGIYNSFSIGLAGPPVLGLVSTVSTTHFQEVGVRSRTQNDIYISTNDFAKGTPIFFHLMVPFQRYLQIILNRCPWV